MENKKDLFKLNVWTILIILLSAILKRFLPAASLEIGFILLIFYLAGWSVLAFKKYVEYTNKIMIAALFFGIFFLPYYIRNLNLVDIALIISLYLSLFIAIGFTKSSTEISNKGKDKVIDTSSIIDGRIKDLYAIHFIEGDLIVPTFVINEIQAIADSADFLKRMRGRRGLDILNEIKKDLNKNVKILNIDYENIKETDNKLIKLCKELNANLITNDFNLNKIAHLENIEVLNINELSNAVKPIALPGEKLKVKVLKEGKENNQGIGYFDDGTMIVVDNAKKYLNEEIEFIVTSSIQTSAGRMIFGKLKKDLK
jgi:uncharacterized protein YacL